MRKLYEIMDVICQTQIEELVMRSRNLERISGLVKDHLEENAQAKAGTIMEKVLVHLNDMIMPYVQKLRNCPDLSHAHLEQISIIESNLQNILFPFVNSNPALKDLNLTPRELQIASLIKAGKTTKEIASLLNLSTSSVDFHRNHLRAKLDIKNKKINLRTHLLSLSC